MVKKEMKKEVILLGKPGSNLRGERWVEEDRQTAFEIYSDPSPEGGRRSFRRTAQLTGIPFQTLARWGREDWWQNQLRDWDHRTASAVRQAVTMRLVNELDGLMDQLVHIAYNGTNKDRTQLEAVKLGLGIASFSPVQKIEQDIIQNITESKKVQVDIVENAGSLEEIAARLNEKMAALSATTDAEDGDIREIEEADAPDPDDLDS